MATRHLTPFAVASAVGLMLLAGCSSSEAPDRTHPTSPAPSTYSPRLGDDAAIIASHIAGCAGPTTIDIGAGTKTGLSSAATCTLDGHVVIIDSFTTSGGPDDVPTLAKGTETYYAFGPGGWLAILADQGVTADKTILQMQITTDAAGLVRASLNGSPTPASLNAQRTILGMVVASIGGQLGHVFA